MAASFIGTCRTPACHLHILLVASCINPIPIPYPMWWQLLCLAILTAFFNLITPVVPAPDKHIMASRTTTHQGSKSEKPSPKQKPSFLQSAPVSPMEPDFLKDDDDFLREDNDAPSPLPLKYQDAPLVIEKQSSNSNVDRLVIAIDYGTTFTGKSRVKSSRHLTDRMQASLMLLHPRM